MIQALAVEMKFILLLLITIFSSTSYAGFISNGVYNCSEGGIYCPQKIERIFFGDKIIGIDVEFIGDCEGQGHIFFSCENLDYCSGISQRITFVDESSYWWKHDIYDFSCYFTLTRN